MNRDQYLKYIYHKQGNPAYLGGENALLREAKKKFPTLKRSDVVKFLSELPYYNVNSEKNKKIKKEHPKFLTTTPFQSMSCDLAFFSKNKNIWLMCVDDHSSYKISQYVGHKKHSKTVKNALEKLLKRLPRKPGQIRTDKGGEFAGFKNFLNKNEIQYVPLDSYQKAYAAEKFIGDFRKLFRKYQSYTGKKDLHKIMQPLVSTMNRKYNRVTKMTPLEATQMSRAGEVFHNKYGSAYSKMVENSFPKAKYKEGNKVRTINFKNAAEEGLPMNKSRQKFSSSVFTVYKVLPETHPQQYLLTDEQNNLIGRRFIDRHLILQK